MFGAGVGIGYMSSPVCAMKVRSTQRNMRLLKIQGDVLRHENPKHTIPTHGADQ